MRRLALVAFLVLPLLLARRAGAQETTARFGVVPFAGAGVAGVGSSGKLPGFIGLTSLGVEAVGEVMPWGGFGRAEYLSSGEDGRWTAFSVALGASRRAIGTPDTWSLLLRAAPALEFWHGSTGGCAVYLFFPNGCRSALPPPVPGVVMKQAPIYDYSATTLALFLGARLEAPIRSFFLALDVSLVPGANVSGSEPGAMFSARFDLVFGLRDRRDLSAARATPDNTHRIRRQY